MGKELSIDIFGAPLLWLESTGICYDGVVDKGLSRDATQAVLLKRMIIRRGIDTA